MRKITFCLSLLFGLLLSNSVSSQIKKDEPIKIKSFFIDIKAGTFTAITTINIELFNPNNKVLDGEFSFSLSSGQVITGFALDINGKMREGVVVDKQKGRVAYENTIRRRIDPGLLEMTAGDNYRVRVYPMPANGTRKITVTISEQLSIKNNYLVYNLPLDLKDTVLNFDLAIKISQTLEQPLTNEGLIQQRSFLKQIDGYSLNYTDKSIELKKQVSFKIPITENAVCSIIYKTDKYFVARIRSKETPEIRISISSITVFWDVSGSGTKRNIQKDISFLEVFCKEKSIEAITIVVFSNAVHEIRKFNLNRNFDAIKRFLEKNIFDGGTQLGVLDCTKYQSDAYLLFSDGISNYGDAMIKTNSKPVYCVSSSPAADHSLLKKISNKTGGRYIDLNAENVNEAIAGLLRIQTQLLSAKIFKQNINLNTRLPALVDEWITISGKVPNKTESLDLSFGDMGVVSDNKSISFSSLSQCDSGEISSLILLQQFAAQQNENNVIAFATKHGFVTSSTSLIVLDNLDDYIQYGIEPPADLEEEYMKRMGEITQRKEQEKRNAENALVNNLRTSVNQYNERVSWWNKNEPLIVFEDVLKKNIEIKAMLAQRAEERKANSGKNNNSNTNINADDIKSFGNNTLSEVVVTTGLGMSRQQRVLAYSTTVVSSSQLSTIPSQNVAQALAGRIAGVQVIERSAPGATSKIFIRGGIASPNGGEPLFILDGTPVEGDIATIVNMNEVESITVLKGVQGSVLYGSRASNGAIVITRRKTFGNGNRQSATIRYKDLEDVDYIKELKDADRSEMYQRYLEMKDTLSEEPSFYFDAAEVIYYSGDKEKAIRILTNLLEMDNENHQLLRAVGYMFESWGMYEEAISVYQKVLQIKEEEPQSYRDLALAYEKYGNPQAAVDLLYVSLTKNWGPYEDRYHGLRSMLLTEMNIIIKAHKDQIDLSEINGSIIKPLPVDLRIVVDWNKDETDVDLHIIEPSGEECYYSHRESKAGGRMAEDFTQGYGPEEYQIKNAVKGKYSIQVNYYGDRYQKKQIPSFIKLTIYKNYGKPNQAVTIETLIMDNQSGKVEIGSVKF